MTSLPEVRRNKLYTLGEEIANAVVHGIGALLSIAACVLLIVAAAKSGSAMYFKIFIITYVFNVKYSYSLSLQRNDVIAVAGIVNRKPLLGPWNDT